MISIIHPSRSRPSLAISTANKWLSSAKHPKQVEYLLSLDYGAETNERYWQLIANQPFKINTIYGDNDNAIQAINHAAQYALGNIIIVVSDDFDCPFHWDVALTKALEGKSDFVAKTDDGLQPFIITLPIMDRVYYERQGYIYHPDYQHMYSDSHMSCKAFLEGKYINLPIRFPHHHYSTGRNKKGCGQCKS